MNKVKKIGVTITSVLCLFAMTPLADAATNNSASNLSLTVTATISVACDTDPVNMIAITGTGQSAFTAATDNHTHCNVKTNNASGYTLKWAASVATLDDATSDTIAAYTPGTAGTPETWAVAATASEWGGHLGSASTTTTPLTWGSTDNYAGTSKWLNVNTAATEIANRTTQTTAGGDDEVVFFTAEVGSTSWQPTGTYTQTVTFTVTTNP